MANGQTPPALIQAVQQRSHKETLTEKQLDEARKMGVKGLTVKNTQYELLKLVKFQKTRLRESDNFTKHLVKSKGRKRAKSIIKKIYEKANSKN